MTLKNICMLIFFSIFITACSVKKLSQEELVLNKEGISKRTEIPQDLINEINYILFLLKQNDLETLNARFIHAKFPYYELSMDDNQKKVIIQKKSAIDEINNYIDSFDIKKEEAIFDCSPFNDANYGWNKEGVFLNHSKDAYISKFMLQENLLKANSYTQEEINKTILIEKNSYEVIVPYNIIFYLTKIDNIWYITLIDNIKTNCSK